MVLYFFGGSGLASFKSLCWRIFSFFFFGGGLEFECELLVLARDRPNVFVLCESIEAKSPLAVD